MAIEHHSYKQNQNLFENLRIFENGNKIHKIKKLRLRKIFFVHESRDSDAKRHIWHKSLTNYFRNLGRKKMLRREQKLCQSAQISKQQLWPTILHSEISYKKVERTRTVWRNLQIFEFLQPAPYVEIVEKIIANMIRLYLYLNCGILIEWINLIFGCTLATSTFHQVPREISSSLMYVSCFNLCLKIFLMCNLFILHCYE